MPTNHYYGEDRRSSPVLTKDDLKEVIDEVMQKHLFSAAHQFLGSWMLKEQRRNELWEKTKAHLVGWGAVAVIAFFLNSFWNDLVRLLSKGQ